MNNDFPNNSTELDDSDLLLTIQLAKEDDNKAELNATFSVFYKRFIGFIYSICYNKVSKNKLLATELCNEIFAKIFQKIDTFNSDKIASRSKVKSWIGTITNNHLKDIHRLKERDKKEGEELYPDDEKWIEIDKAEELYENQKLTTPHRQALDRALTQIKNKKHKEILIAYYLVKPINGEALKKGELKNIATKFNTTVPNVKKIVQRVYNELEILAKVELTKQHK